MSNNIGFQSPIARSLPLPNIPFGFDNHIADNAAIVRAMASYLRSLHPRLAASYDDIVQQLSKSTSAISSGIVGVPATPTPPAPVRQMMCWVDLLGTKNGSNQTFTVPHPVFIQPDGTPMVGTLYWKTGPQIYTPGSSPTGGMFAMTSATTVIVGSAPDPGDPLKFQYVILA